ncbi:MULTISPECIES: hypothetical protein [Pseudoalteromonas]|uniref:hypothetical protein n=1 Tax=Pseudoalteromonas TaxID=53246 RepID=UPI0015825343|nr:MULTISPECIES: hypothetical protein [Pseudoalteromonas]MDI4654588.1 hypothetical protein [Pseudoalteromonas shioyasakiensis]NUJ40143.1 hypothetical protein [Pseudoalteromonas sp. 0303]
MAIEVTEPVLEKAVRDLIAFNEFTFYYERDTDECTGLTFALEFLFCSLNKVRRILACFSCELRRTVLTLME